MVSLPRSLTRDAILGETMPDAVRARHRRDQVLDAATGVFAKRGNLGTTVDHIVAAAHIGVGSFYEMFDGKDDCFVQVYDRIANDARARLQHSVEDVESPPGQVCAGLRALLRFFSEDLQRARLALVEIETAGPEALAHHHRNLDAALPLLSRCRSLSSFDDRLPNTLERATIGGALWLVHQRLVVTSTAPLEELYPELVGIVLGPYFGEEEAARFAATY